MDGILGFILKAVVACVVPNLINIIIFYRTEEFRELKCKIVNPIIKKITGKMTKV